LYAEWSLVSATIRPRSAFITEVGSCSANAFMSNQFARALTA
jgi:hypothetical protein